MSKSKNFSIFYDSDETKDHTIDAEVLGQSLISFSKAVKKADRVINGSDSTLEIDVKAHKEGSFGVTYEITQLLQSSLNVIEYIGITAATSAVVGGSVMALINNIAGRKMKGVVREGDDKSVIELDDGTKIECDRRLEELVTDQDFRKNYEDVFYTPIKNDPTAKVILKDSELKPLEVINQTQSENFKSIGTKSVETKEENVVTNIRFTQVNFDSGNKGWRAELPKLDSDVAVKIEDSKFLNSVDNSQQSMVKGSLFEVKLRIKTFFKINNSPSYKYTILEVIRHRTSSDKKLI
ncbi:hypothetical protein [Pseudoalteromonas sp. TAB23]|uniref:hypothetical protein n=1 Tax=Pseudoalteromonas sp. TAB23 TaxID=1938595 RepID=UPI000405C77B|nr:hypothetical protein [Pseudoalteromonas sp. TAB23]